MDYYRDRGILCNRNPIENPIVTAIEIPAVVEKVEQHSVSRKRWGIEDVSAEMGLRETSKQLRKTGKG